jgi:hypothetical protein
MKILYAACLAMACCLVTGCRGPDQDALDALAASLISAGDRLDDVRGRLDSEGFECDMKSSWPRAHCSRRKGSLIHACVESVTLVLDPTRNRVVDVKASKVSCAGL